VRASPDIKNVKKLVRVNKRKKKIDFGQNHTNRQLILLDENGKNFSSVGFWKNYKKKMNSDKTLVFCSGGHMVFGYSLSKAKGKYRFL
jgi:23S rRNA (pseudouridine1915-N3)-methyltransferase